MSDQFVPPGFVFVKTLTSGFLGPSYLIKKEDTQVSYICKGFMKSAIGDEADVDNFIQIIRITRKIKETCFLPYHYYYDEKNYIYAVRPFFEGLDLTAYITNCADNVNVVIAQWKVLVRLYRHLHKRRIYPNFIKPSNIFMQNGGIAFITDIYPPPRQFNPTLHRSNPFDVGFLAPEYLSPDTIPDIKSDIWSLGILLWFMITKKLPWNLNNVVVMLKQIQAASPINLGLLPPEVRDIASSMLNLDPESRIDTEYLVHSGTNTLLSSNHPLTEQKSASQFKAACGEILKPIRTTPPTSPPSRLFNVRRRVSDYHGGPKTDDDPLANIPRNLIRVASRQNRSGSLSQIQKVKF